MEQSGGNERVMAVTDVVTGDVLMIGLGRCIPSGSAWGDGIALATASAGEMVPVKRMEVTPEVFQELFDLSNRMRCDG